MSKTDYPGLSQHHGAVVKHGTCLYDNTVRLPIVITEHNVRYGSGDHEDPPEVRNDIPTKCFYVFYGSGNPLAFNTGGGCFESLEAAMENVGNALSDVRWDDDVS